MGSSRVRWLVVAIVVVVASAGCTSSRRYPDKPKPTDNRGTPAITVKSGGRVSVGGVTVTIPPHGVDRDSILHVTVVPNLATPAGTSIATPVVAVALEGARLTKPAVIELPITDGIDPGTVIGGFFDPASRGWKPLASRPDRPARILHVTTPHFTRFFGIRIDQGPIVRDLTDKLQNVFTGRAGAGYPTCAGDHDHSDGITYTSDSGDLVKWCTGFSSGHRELTVVNNRAAAVTVTYPSAWPRSSVTGSGSSFASLDRRLSTQAPPPRGYAYVVVGAGGSVVFKPPHGAAGRVTVKVDILTWALSGFDVAVSAAVAVYEKFLKLPANQDKILAGALTDDAAAGAVDFAGCMKTALGADVDPRRSVADAGFDQTMQAKRVATKCGFSYVQDWIEQHVKNVVVGTVLAVVSTTLGFVVSGVAAAFGGVRNLYDTAKRATEYTINLNAGTTKPSVEHTANGEYTVRFTHPLWGPVRLITHEQSDDETVSGPASITVYDATNRVRFRWDGTFFYRLQPAGIRPGPGGLIYGSGYDDVTFAIDRLGHIFIYYNPGRYDGVIVLGPTAAGLSNFGSLPAAGSNTSLFYSATAVDPDGDGIYEIETLSNDCDPSCAEGMETSTAYKWDGTNYTALVPRKVDTSKVLDEFLAGWKAGDTQAQLAYATPATVEKFRRDFQPDSYKVPRAIESQRCALNQKRFARCELLLDRTSRGHSTIVRVLLHEDGFGKVDIDTLTNGGDAG